MIRIGVMKSAKLRAASLALLALVVMAVARPASAQDKPAAAPPPEDLLKFSTSAPTLIIFQIHADKAADFESGWSTIRAGFAKVQDADHKAFGETINKLYKLDQPPMDTPAGKAVVYVLQIDAPSTTLSYNPGKIVYDILWKTGAEGAPMSRSEADELFKKLQPAFQSITPWKLSKIG